MAKPNSIDKAIANLEAERDVLALAIEKLKAQRTVKAERVATGRKPGRPRKLAEAALGRPLRGREEVHHADGNSLNNARTIAEANVHANKKDNEDASESSKERSSGH